MSFPTACRLFQKKFTNTGITLFNSRFHFHVDLTREDHSLAYETDFDMILDIVIPVCVDFLNSL